MSGSDRAAGQRKRQREEKGLGPLQIHGGYVERENTLNERDAMPNYAAGAGYLGAPRYNLMAPGRRTHLHHLWNQAAHPQNAHFDTENFPLWDPIGGEGQKTTSWEAIDQNDFEASQAPCRNPLQEWPNYPEGTVMRDHEEAQLIASGAQAIAISDDVPNPQDGRHPMPWWSFMGIADSFAFGMAWSCFYYTMTDLFVGGIPRISDLCASVSQILADVQDISAGAEEEDPIITDDMRVILHFEGATDVLSQARRFIVFNRKPDNGGTLGAIRDDPTKLLDCVGAAMMSEGEYQDFRFFRVYVHVLTGLGGGTLADMPPKFRELRESKWFKGNKGYTLIEDSPECACGLDAVVRALVNAMRRIATVLKRQNHVVPKLCSRFSNFRKKASKGNLALTVETKLELATHIGWKRGEHILPDQLCLAVRRYAAEHELKLGLVVFDALNPLTRFWHSFEGSEVPHEVLNVVYWQYPSTIATIAGGHYDCIEPKNVTSWIQRGETKRPNYKYSYRQFKLIKNTQADYKGNFCERCCHWQKQDATDEVWYVSHGTLGHVTHKCDDCESLFKSAKCYALHRVKSHGSAKTACESQRKCVKCGRIHVDTYDCTVFYCTICADKFPVLSRESHQCFLPHVTEKKRSRLRRVAYSDMEGSRADGFHKAVAVATAWGEMCGEHALEYDGRKEMCKDCTSNKDGWGYWCAACADLNPGVNDCKACLEAHSSIFTGDNCLDEYLEWVMARFAGGTVVFHNGGKYDLHILYVSLLASGKYNIRRDASRANQIIYMQCCPAIYHGTKKPKGIRFIDSCNFIAASLRSFPSMFDIGETRKGTFPYDLLNEKDWQLWNGKCPPPALFGITEKEYNNVDKLTDGRKREVKGILSYIESWKDSEEPWVAVDELVAYTICDVMVLKKGCEEFRMNTWMAVRMDPFHWVTLAAAVAGCYRQPRFMPLNSIQICPQRMREWQRLALRGGKCEPFKLYWKPTKNTQRLVIVDYNSQYPYTQAFFPAPEGGMTADLDYDQPVDIVKACVDFERETKVPLLTVLTDVTGAAGVGMIECYIESGDAMFPILPSKIKVGASFKNMFMNRVGRWNGFINILALAIKHGQVIVKSVTRIMYWKNTTKTLFREFICSLYARKVEASGWAKIFNKKDYTPEEVAAYCEESNRRGVKINPENVKDNPGMRTTSKTICNCGWGYLCTRPHADECLYFNNTIDAEVQAMTDLLDDLDTEKNPRRMVGLPSGIGIYTKIKTTKDSSDITTKEMNKKVAYQTGGITPAWGLCLLSESILALHPAQPVYSDTDSIFYVEDTDNEHFKSLPTGLFMGDFVEEYPDYRITEYVCIGPKSYFVKMESKDGKVAYKGRFKGLPMNSGIFSMLDPAGELASLGMEEMKNILFQSLYQRDNPEEEVDGLTMEFRYQNFFKRGRDMKIRAVEEKKRIRFTFDKRRVLPCLDSEGVPMDWHDTRISEVNTGPINDMASILEADEILNWWDELPGKIIKYKQKRFIT